VNSRSVKLAILAQTFTFLRRAEFCKRLLLETRVGIAPGVAFGAGGEHSVRICYAADRGVLEAAMDRLDGFLRRY
jgi:aspartate aminotransferase